MGYFDGVTDAIFKKDASGNTLFYPWGIFGSGFIIDSEDRKDQIRGLIKTIYIIMIPAIVIIQVTVGAWLNLVLLPVFIVWYCFTVKKLTKGLQKTEEKLRVSEAYKNSAKSHNLPTLIILEFTSLGFVGLGIWILLKGKNPLIAYAAIGLFGLCSVAIGYMIIAKIRQKKMTE